MPSLNLIFFIYKMGMTSVLTYSYTGRCKKQVRTKVLLGKVQHSGMVS